MGSRKRLGAIAIFGVSMVSVCSLELSQCFAQYHFLGRVDFELPQQFFTSLKVASKLIQELMYKDFILHLSKEVYQKMKLKRWKISTFWKIAEKGVGDEGGFVPKLGLRNN